MVLFLLWVIGRLLMMLILTDVLRVSHLYIIPGSPAAHFVYYWLRSERYAPILLGHPPFSRDVSGFPRSSRVLGVGGSVLAGRGAGPM